MRVCKLSDKIFGFDTFEGCKAYFRNVLPWSKYYFPIFGEGNRISKDRISVDENVLFIYKGNIVAIAKIEDFETVAGKVTSLKLREDTLRIFEQNVEVKELEQQLSQNGYSSNINRSEGWNIIPKEHESTVINYLIHQEWKPFLL